MKIHDMSPAPGARKEKRRLGRGTGSGLGKTSGKGHKGQWARSGGGVRPGFEGGQMPLMRRIPKTGFTNNWRKEYTTVNIGALEAFEKGTVVTAELLLEKGIIRKLEHYGLKILGGGELTKALTVRAAKFTKSAEEIITKNGGKAEVV